MASKYVLRVQQPHGSWKFDFDCAMSKREAESEAKRNRIYLGVLCQVWTENETTQVVAKNEAAAAPAV